MSRTAIRTFEDAPGVRASIPLLLGIMGPSGGGKTYSALELATGIQEIDGGDIGVIDTETRRALHYADLFKFRHLDFQPPFGSLDYLSAIQHFVKKGVSIIVVDSFSLEHEGPGGLLEAHEAELERLTRGDDSKRERYKMQAWIKPKADRRKLRIGILQTGAHMIFCFRAKEGAKPIKKDGKLVVENSGFVPIAGDEFVYEMAACMLLMPHANGVPTWKSEHLPERTMMKLPTQFRGLLDTGQPLSRSIGRQLAEWARGGVKAQVDLVALGDEQAAKGMAALEAWWKSIPPTAEKRAAAQNLTRWKDLAGDADAVGEAEFGWRGDQKEEPPDVDADGNPIKF